MKKNIIFILILTIMMSSFLMKGMDKENRPSPQKNKASTAYTLPPAKKLKIKENREEKEPLPISEFVKKIEGLPLDALSEVYRVIARQLNIIHGKKVEPITYNYPALKSLVNKVPELKEKKYNFYTQEMLNSTLRILNNIYLIRCGARMIEGLNRKITDIGVKGLLELHTHLREYASPNPTIQDFEGEHYLDRLKKDFLEHTSTFFWNNSLDQSAHGSLQYVFDTLPEPTGGPEGLNGRHFTYAAQACEAELNRRQRSAGENLEKAPKIDLATFMVNPQPAPNIQILTKTMR